MCITADHDHDPYICVVSLTFSFSEVYPLCVELCTVTFVSAALYMYVVCIFYLIHIFRGCLRQPLYCFHFDFRYVTLVRYIYIYIYTYIYIICVPTRNRNNEFILEFILREIKMANFER